MMPEPMHFSYSLAPLWSRKFIGRLRTFPSSSTRTVPCICAQKAIPSTPSGLTSDPASTSFVVEHSAAHHSSVSCSTPPSSEMYRL